MRSLLLLLAAATAGCAGLFDGDVPRKVHGRVYIGPFVPEEAYAAFLEGSLAEQQQEPERAEQAYRRAASLDRRHPDPWVRIGALRCARSDRPGSDDAFARAARVDPAFGPLLREQARCAAAQGAPAQARALALQAVAADPADTEPPLLLARLALSSDDPQEARRWITALLLRTPQDAGALAFLREHQAHPALAPLARRALQDAPVPLRSPAQSVRLTLPELDQALLGASPEWARSLARRAGLTPGELASRAAALGLRALAAEQGRLVLEADPSSADARIALLVAGTAEEVELALALPPGTPTAPSAVGTLLLAELLLRRSGPEAARSVLRHAVPPREDLLAVARLARLEQRLVGP